LDPTPRNSDYFPDIVESSFMGLHEAGEMLHGDFSELEPLFVDAENSRSDVARVNASPKE
jgi:hypothetical protein